MMFRVGAIYMELNANGTGGRLFERRRELREVLKESISLKAVVVGRETA
jgi:hypothetical protein